MTVTEQKPLTDRFSIGPIRIHGSEFAIELSTKLLGGGAKRTIPFWGLVDAIPGSGLRIPSTQIYGRIFNFLNDTRMVNENYNLSMLRNALHTDFELGVLASNVFSKQMSRYHAPRYDTPNGNDLLTNRISISSEIMANPNDFEEELSEALFGVHRSTIEGAVGHPLVYTVDSDSDQFCIGMRFAGMGKQRKFEVGFYDTNVYGYARGAKLVQGDS